MSGPLNESVLRRHSVATLEINDPSGRRRTVQLDELNADDRALAEQFGYKPVRRKQAVDGMPPLTKDAGLQTRVWLPLDLFVCRQHLWTVCHRDDDVLIPPLRRRFRLGGLVLADFWRGMYVHRLLGRRAGVGVSDLWRPLLHGFAPGSEAMGAVHQLGHRLDQPAGSSGRHRLF